MEKKKKKGSKIFKRLVISFSAIIILYLGTTIYFTDRFYFGSSINSVSIAGKTVEEARDEIASKVDTYTLNLEKRGGEKEQIKGTDISLRYNPDAAKLQNIKDSQNPFQWFISLFIQKEHEVTEMVSFDEEKLNVLIDDLNCLDSEKVIKSKNPTFKYTENGYEIVKEVYGDSIDRNILYENIVKAISNGNESLNLEENNCYEKPKYTESSPEVINTKDTLNKYIASNITYSMGGKNEVVNKDIIKDWISADGEMKISFNESKIKEYVNKLSTLYNTVGKTRNFNTSLGTTVKVNGGDYGWIINLSKEVDELIAVVKEGKTTTKEPVYIQKAASRDINDFGKTYVEINLTKQHIWFYKNGELITEGPIVTGDVKQKHATPGGTYILKYKQRDTVLRGEDYASPVSYWMPFNGGIGLHDATWRSEFGGNIYIANGSHGCVNLQFNVAQTIFNNIEAGVPIICYF